MKECQRLKLDIIHIGRFVSADKNWPTTSPDSSADFVCRQVSWQVLMTADNINKALGQSERCIPNIGCNRPRKIEHFLFEREKLTDRKFG